MNTYKRTYIQTGIHKKAHTFTHKHTCTRVHWNTDTHARLLINRQTGKHQKEIDK